MGLEGKRAQADYGYDCQGRRGRAPTTTGAFPSAQIIEVAAGYSGDDAQQL